MAGAVAKWLQLVANMIMVGTCVFFVIVSYDKATFQYALLDRLERALPWFAAALAVLLLAELAAKTADITDVASDAWKPSSWLGVIKNTWLGKVWAARMALVLVLIPIAIYVRSMPSARWRYLLCATVAGAALAAAAFSGHAAAEESPVLAITPYAVHILMAGIWFGGLPALIAVLYGMAQSRTRDAIGLQAIGRFSLLALPVMLVIIATGSIIANNQVGTRYAALVSTDYGWFLLIKLLLLCAILAIAAYARFVWLPALESGPPTETKLQPMRRGVTVEFGLATLLVLVATLCASSIPAKHAIIDHWPYPFRFSIAAAFELPETVTNLVTAAALCAGAVALGYVLTRCSPNWRRGVLSTCLVLAVAGIALSLYAIATKASVDSYRNSSVPFNAISIAKGASLYAANCTPCHGLQGKGDGPLAAGLTVPPVDLLTEQHSKRHSPGDFYNWIGAGIPESGMPGFGQLSDDDRWDIVNYLHLISRGYESRTLRPRVVPDRPSQNLGAPDFSFVDQHGVTRTLKDYRLKQSVLLVFFSWPGDAARLEAIRSEYEAIRNRDAAVIAIPLGRQAPDASWAQTMPFPVVQQGSDIARTYAEFRRSIADPDLFGPGKTPTHMELLVDRFGYLRGRWIPEQDSSGWSDGNTLETQLSQLMREKQILPPAGDHVH